MDAQLIGQPMHSSAPDNYLMPVSTIREGLEVSVIASTDMPSNVSTLPLVSKLSFKRIFDTKAVDFCFKAFVSKTGYLCVEEPIDWIPFVRIARNCFEQNLSANLSHNKTTIVLTTIRRIKSGEELKVWPSYELIIDLNIPFLKPNNIINNHCYQCNNCGQSFSQPNPLKIHLSIDCKQTIEQNITSNSIENIYQRNGQTLREQRSHTCLYCGKIYTRKYGLKIHVRTHTGQKPLRCRFCGRPFSDPSNLNKHIRLHSQHNGLQSTPYKCKLCSKVLVRRRDLERHMKSRHQSI